MPLGRQAALATTSARRSRPPNGLAWVPTSHSSPDPPPHALRADIERVYTGRHGSVHHDRWPTWEVNTVWYPRRSDDGASVWIRHCGLCALMERRGTPYSRHPPDDQQALGVLWSDPDA